MKRVLACLAVGISLASPVSAATIFQITLDTSSLQPLGRDFLLDLQFLDGDPASNGVDLTGFSFGAGGAAVGAPILAGGASGTAAGIVSLRDTDFFNAFTQQFTPGSLLTFTLAFVDPVTLSAAIPDRFALFLLELDFTTLATTGFGDEFLGIDLSIPMTITTFDSPVFAIPAPAVTAIPEPASLALLGLGLVAVVRRRFDRAVS